MQFIIAERLYVVIYVRTEMILNDENAEHIINFILIAAWFKWNVDVRFLNTNVLIIQQTILWSKRTEQLASLIP